jgi:O6-methylguanine-DNA--protein-cysteine methyltransferase
MQETWYDVFESSWGWIGVIGSAKGIRYCSLPEETPDRAVEYVSELVKGKLPEQRSGVFDQFEREIEEYFAGDRQRWDVALDVDDATEFFRRAWAACRSIPPGETRTYKWLAAQAGNPAASRAHRHSLPPRAGQRWRVARVRRARIAAEGTLAAARGGADG